ncbi:ShlB/FhaC/HecB family hemolysin secretion/activation protein [Roseomonas chloroacetimidivorans]|uniref:ShlB/FhaC/HecB family hemolysin secretion/activation protein n=1 Tax=Roseomonas chloroacetimidivorans TaxID=1766656 RepID=UPI003C792C69
MPPPTESIQRLAPSTAPTPAPPLQPPLPRAERGPGETQRIQIGRVEIRGNVALSTERLRERAAELEGRTVALSEIEEKRLEVLLEYRHAGYPFVAVSADLQPGPTGATLSFTVTEAVITEVRLEGDLGPAGTQILRFLNRLVGMRPLSNSALERALLLSSDVPGVRVSGILRPLPGEGGGLQLVAQVSRRSFSGYATLDNRAFALTGPYQGIISGTANSFTEFGEQTELLFYDTEGNRQPFVQAGSEVFVGGSGLRVRVYAGIGRARPGSQLAALGYEGDTRVGGVGVTYPLLRTRPVSLWLTGGLDIFESEVRQGISGPKQRASFDAVRTLRVGIDTAFLDELIPFLPPATNQGQLRFSHGLSTLGASSNDDQLVARLGSEFDFRKATAEWSRRQAIALLFDEVQLSAQGLVSVQWSDSVLPPSEKFYFGGNRLGRGFYAGQVTGDRAAGYALELQFDRSFEFALPELGDIALASQFYLFRDYGRAFENNTDPNRRISSYGLGFRLVANDRVAWDVEAAQRTTRRVDAAGSQARPLDAGDVYTRILIRF